MMNCAPLYELGDPAANNTTAIPGVWDYQDAISEDVNTTGNKALYQSVYHILYGYGLPTICVFGFLGNVMNLIILAGKQAHRTLRRAEASANIGLIALAVADMNFCVLAFPSTFLPLDMKFHKKGFLLYYGCYCAAVINIFIMTSTWITVAMSTERYLAICHPLKSRKILSLTRTKIVIVLVYVFSLVFNLPMFWRYTITELRCWTNGLLLNQTVFSIHPVVLYERDHVEHGYRAAWAVVGNFVPLFLLLLFNIALMREIHKSYAMRKRMNCVATHHSTDSDSNNRITITLVAIVVMFFVFVAPSEVLKHLAYLFGSDVANNYTYLTIEIITNVMQTINFSANFILYCIISPSFRRTMREMFCFQYQRINKTDRDNSMSWKMSVRGAHAPMQRLSSKGSSKTNVVFQDSIISCNEQFLSLILCNTIFIYYSRNQVLCQYVVFIYYCFSITI